MYIIASVSIIKYWTLDNLTIYYIKCSLILFLEAAKYCYWFKCIILFAYDNDIIYSENYYLHVNK